MDELKHDKLLRFIDHFQTITLSEKEVKARFKIRNTYFEWEKYNNKLKNKTKTLKSITYKIKRDMASSFLIKNGIMVINE